MKQPSLRRDHLKKVRLHPFGEHIIFYEPRSHTFFKAYRSWTDTIERLINFYIAQHGSISLHTILTYLRIRDFYPAETKSCIYNRPIQFVYSKHFDYTQIDIEPNFACLLYEKE